jgi:hypothetical protein
LTWQQRLRRARITARKHADRRQRSGCSSCFLAFVPNGSEDPDEPSDSSSSDELRRTPTLPTRRDDHNASNYFNELRPVCRQLADPTTATTSPPRRMLRWQFPQALRLTLTPTQPMSPTNSDQSLRMPTDARRPHTDIGAPGGVRGFAHLMMDTFCAFF